MGTEADKQNIGVIVTIVAVGAFAMIAVSLAVTALVRAEVKELSTERSAAADLNTVRELKGAQRSALSRPAHWADRAKGLVAIPLERAMQLVAEDLRRNPHLATASLPGKDEADAGAPTADSQEPDQEQELQAEKKEGDQKRSPDDQDGAKKGPAPQTPGAAPAPPPSAPAPLAPAPPAPAPVSPPASAAPPATPPP